MCRIDFLIDCWRVLAPPFKIFSDVREFFKYFLDGTLGQLHIWNIWRFGVFDKEFKSTNPDPFYY